MTNYLEIKKKILVIDDESLIRELLGEIIIMLGYEPILCGLPTEAINIFSKYHDEISLIFMDMIMPEINGRQLFKEFIKINSSKKVIILSGFTFEHEAEELFQDGITDFIQKPISVKEITDIIIKHID